MHYTYETKNTCSTAIEFDMSENIVTNIHFSGGCDGNLKAIPLLIDGWTAEKIIEKTSGIRCGRRPTSCADQLAMALQKALEDKNRLPAAGNSDMIQAEVRADERRSVEAG